MLTVDEAIQVLRNSVDENDTPLDNLANTDEAMEQILYEWGYDELAEAFGEVQTPFYNELFEKE